MIEGSMWESLKDLFQISGGSETAALESEQAARVATAALLVRASLVDGKEDTRETERLNQLMKERFALSEDQAADLIARGRAEEAKAVDLYGFTRVLTDHLGREGRSDIVEMLWEIVLSDKVVDDYEAHLVWRVAELLHITTRERVVLRQKVMARLGLKE